MWKFLVERVTRAWGEFVAVGPERVAPELVREPAWSDVRTEVTRARQAWLRVGRY